MDKFAGTFRELRIKYLPPTIRTWALLLLMMTSCGGLFAYSVLTHEEIVDLAWTDKIQPLLLMRFPGLTEDQIREAHSYAYGGAVIQDLGYYPFGSVEFSDLVHYVRSGDFVRELLVQSQDANEFDGQPGHHVTSRNCTTAPGRSSAGGSAAASHNTASVWPSSCQPPGETRG